MGQRIGQVLEIRVVTAQHKSTDLLMAYSDDLPGLLVPGRSHEEIREKLPEAIKEILEANGNRVARVEANDENSDLPENFHLSGFLAKAEMTVD